MANLDDPIDCGDEPFPALPLIREHLPSGPGDPVITTPALPGLFDPPPLNPAALLQPVQQRVEGRHCEADGALGLLLDHLAHLVAVTGALVDQRQDHELGAALFELAVQNPGVDILHSKILLYRSRRRQAGGGRISRRRVTSGDLAAVFTDRSWDRVR